MLRDTGVIRSDRYLGNIAEFLCSDYFGIRLTENLREPGRDGHLHGAAVQIKYHGRSSTTVDLGDPDVYSAIFIVLGPESQMRPEGETDEFLVYRLDSEEVKSFRTKRGKHYCTRNRLPASPATRLNLVQRSG